MFCPRDHKVRKKDWSRIGANDIYYVRHITKNATKKSNNRINNCLRSISNLKPRETKSYQYKEDRHELKKILDFLKDKPFAYKLVENDQLLVNKLVEIIPGLDSGCCGACDNGITFINKKVPSKFIMVTKK